MRPIQRTAVFTVGGGSSFSGASPLATQHVLTRILCCVTLALDIMLVRKHKEL